VKAIFKYNPFKWKNDGCIYDKIRYEFESTSKKIDFIKQDLAEISMIIDTSDVDLAGVYDIKLAAYANPVLRAEYLIRLTMEVPPPINTGAPLFKGSGL